ncbi:hypothetical protein BD770DRAFT_414198 [Pilaira anomala]|nr:hypothetical protein BD770DRAFT_414198 [Pilaira anomala]
MNNTARDMALCMFYYIWNSLQKTLVHPALEDLGVVYICFVIEKNYINTLGQTLRSREVKKKRLQNACCDICYNITPNQPILVSAQRILDSPLTYRKYLDVVPVEEVGQKRKRRELRKF